MALPFLILSAASREAAFATNVGGYRPGGAHRPFAAALSLAIAGGVGATLMLALVIPEFAGRSLDPIDATNIPIPPKPTVDDPVVDQPVRDRTVTLTETRFDPLLDTSRDFTFETRPIDFGEVTVDPGFGSGGGIVRPVDPPPVLRDATRDMRFSRDFQPAYPSAREREGIEGRCPVTVTIAPSGRVSRVVSNGCADSAFFAATERQALNRWRFRPATRDGVAVESTQDIAVTFQMPREDR